MNQNDTNIFHVSFNVSFQLTLSYKIIPCFYLSYMTAEQGQWSDIKLKSLIDFNQVQKSLDGPILS